MILDPWFYVLAVPALMIVGISKGGFGSGIGLIAVPMMALTVPVPQAAAIMLPLLCVMDLVGLWTYWRRWDNAAMKALLPAAVIGVVVGALTFRLLSEPMLRLAIGLVAVAFVLDQWLGWRPKGDAAPNKGKAYACGALSGYTSFVAHAGGPPLSVYLLPQRMDKTAFVATTVVFFAVVNYAKLLPYWALGQLPAGNLATSAALLPLAPAGMALGFWLHRRIDALVFFRICHWLLLLTGTKLLWDGLRALA